MDMTKDQLREAALDLRNDLPFRKACIRALEAAVAVSTLDEVTRVIWTSLDGDKKSGNSTRNSEITSGDGSERQDVCK